MMVHPVRIGALALGIATSLAPTFTHATTYQAQLLEPVQLAQPLVDGRFEATANNAAGLTVGSVRFNTPKQINLPPLPGQSADTTRFTSVTNEAAFVSANGQLTRLGTQGRDNSWATAVNAQGQIVGQSSTVEAFSSGSLGQGGGSSSKLIEQQAFIHEQGTTKDLGTLGGKSSTAVAINDSGQVIGNATTAGEARLLGYVYAQGKMTAIAADGFQNSFASAINNAGLVTGAVMGESMLERQAYTYQDGVMTVIPVGGAFSEGVALSSDGRVVGNVTQQNGNNELFVYANGEVTLIGGLPTRNPNLPVFSEAQGINAKGQVVGRTLTDEYHAFVYENGVITDLNLALDPASSGRLALTSALSIDDDGRILALGEGNKRYLLTPMAAVPEAGTTSLMALGLLALAMQKRRKAH
jgi:probable HAF family extracellular repeat protein